MAGNTFGNIFRLTTFGESHGSAIGGVIDGCPAGLEIDTDFIQKELDRRRPGQSEITTPRDEKDKVEMLSGIFEGKTTGTPIAFIIYNKDQNPKDYDHLKNLYRPSHADFTYDKKYGIRDYRGGGRSSARETAARVVGGSIAKFILQTQNINIQAYVSQIGHVILEKDYPSLNLELTEKSAVRCPDEKISDEMINLIEKLKSEGDSTGGTITCVIKEVSPGIGEPVFDKLHADLAKAMLSINAVKGFEYGSGFKSASMKGSEHNDTFIKEGDRITTETNYSGGIQGGISTGQDIYFRVAFKPVATIMSEQMTIDKNGNKQKLKGKGRHDVCIVPRAVPIVESMAALVIADHFLRNKVSRL